MDIEGGSIGDKDAKLQNEGIRKARVHSEMLSHSS
jgi:hypothetical protein